MFIRIYFKSYLSIVACVIADSRQPVALQVPVCSVDEGLGIVLYLLQDCQLRKHIFKSCFILNQRRAMVLSTLTSFIVRILPTPVLRFTHIRRGPGLIYLNSKCLWLDVRITLSDFRVTM